MPMRVPDDVLQHIVVLAARTHSKTALTLALVSRTAYQWVFDVLYEDVDISSQRKAILFLRTLKCSNPKAIELMIITVKSLVVSPDVELGHLVDIMALCLNVENLTYWPLREIPNGPRTNRIPGGQTLCPSPINVAHLQQLHYLAPRRLSTVFHENFPIPLFRPPIQIPFFRNITHLTINNVWQQWTLWAPQSICSAYLPNLICIKFDLIVGPSLLQSQSELLGSSSFSDAQQNNSASIVDQDPIPFAMSNIRRVTDCLSGILCSNHTLLTCVLVLRFDSDPATTSSTISMLVSDWICRNSGEYLGFKPGFDPRLVLFWEKEPFRATHAHSPRETKLWKAADTIVKAQTSLEVMDHLLIDSDDLKNMA